MKTDNIFRFVALRGPDPRPEQDGRTVRLVDDQSFEEDIRRRVAAGEPPERARAAAAGDFMNSERYVTRNPSGRLLMQHQGRAGRLLADARRTLDAGAFRQGLQALLGTVFGTGFNLEQFVESRAFVELRRDFWHSYYSNLVLVTRRPQDRPGLLVWIRLFELLPGAFDEETFAQRVQDLETARLVIPHELAPVQEPVRETGGPGPDSGQADRERRLRVEALSSELARLQAALADVRAVYRERLFAAEGEEPAPGSDGREHPAGNEDGDREPPWQLSDENLQPDTHEVLSSLRITVRQATAPVIVDALQNRVAQVHSQLYHARRVDEVVYRRGTFIRTRRKRV